MWQSPYSFYNTRLKSTLISFILLFSGSLFADAQQPEIIVQSGLSANITSFCYSPDERYLLVATLDSKVKLFDAESKVELASLTTQDIITSMAFTDEAGKIILISVNNWVFYVDLLRDKNRCKLIVRADNTIPSKFTLYSLTSEVIITNGAEYIISESRNAIHFLDANTLEEKLEIKGKLVRGNFINHKIAYTSDKMNRFFVDSVSLEHNELKVKRILEFSLEELQDYYEEFEFIKEDLVDQTENMYEAFLYDGKEVLNMLQLDENGQNIKFIISQAGSIGYLIETRDYLDSFAYKAISLNYLGNFSIQGLKSLLKKDPYDFKHDPLYGYGTAFPLVNFTPLHENEKVVVWDEKGNIMLYDYFFNLSPSDYIYRPEVDASQYFYSSKGIFYQSLNEENIYLLERAAGSYYLIDNQFTSISLDTNLIVYSYSDSLYKKTFFEDDYSNTLSGKLYLLMNLTDSNLIALSNLSNYASLIHIEEGEVSPIALPDSMLIMQINISKDKNHLWLMALSKGNIEEIKKEMAKSIVYVDEMIKLDVSYPSGIYIYKVALNHLQSIPELYCFYNFKLETSFLTNPSTHHSSFYFIEEDTAISFGIADKITLTKSLTSESSKVIKADEVKKQAQITKFHSGGEIIYRNSNVHGTIANTRFDFKINAKDLECISFNEKNELIALIYKNGYYKVKNLSTDEEITEFTACDIGVPSYTFEFFQNCKYLLIGASNGLILFWDYINKKEVFRFYQLPEQKWVLVSDNGLFDAQGEVDDYIKFIIRDTLSQHDYWKVINLKDLKHRYYQPNLFQIALGHADEGLRDVSKFNTVEFAPNVKLLIDKSTLHIALSDQGGGIGQVSLYMDGIEVEENILLDQGTLSGQINLQDYAKWFNSRAANTIKVIAFNEGNWLSNESNVVIFMSEFNQHTENQKKGATALAVPLEHNVQPNLYAIICGVSDYTGDAIDLQYAAKDAENFAKSIQLSAEELFGEDHVHIKILSTAQQPENYPSRSKILTVMKETSVATADDIVLVYLSGHGVNFGGQDGDFFFLTQESSQADAAYLNDPFVRNNYSISSKELIGILNEIPARKKLMIVDACAAGKAAETLIAEARHIPASQIRALDRLKDRTGFYVLAGSASDAVSYETSVYGQGLLTYSLLKAMKGAALRKDGNEEYIDVQTLFQFAVDEVPVLAHDIGGIQKPLFRSPSEQRSFDIGKVNTSIKEKITLAEPKAVFTSSAFVHASELFDVYELSTHINAELMELNKKGRESTLLFIPAKSYPGAYKISGTYKEEENRIIVNFVIRQDNQRIGPLLTIEGNKEHIQNLVSSIIEKAQNIITNK